MQPFKVFLGVSITWITVCTTMVACSWDNPIWPKDKRSDTALFRFVTDGKAGFINVSGKIMIPARFPVVGFGNEGYDDFFEGVAAMNTLRKDHIDSHGTAIDFSPYDVSGFSHFSEGLIPATTHGGKVRKYGFIDHRGKLVIPTTFDGVGDFAESLAPVAMKGKWGYIDHAGKVVIPTHFNLAESFSEGAARVILEGPCNYIGYGPCANSNPSILGFPEYKSGRDSRYAACRYTFIDRQGIPLFPQKFLNAFDFSEGLAAAGDGTYWGFIDKTGVFRIPPQFEYVGSFSEGLAKFRRNRKWGYIDKAGRVVIPPWFENSDDFSAGAAVVGKLYYKVWFIDKLGKKLFGTDYEAASSFRLGLAHVNQGRDFAYIDRTGTRVFTYRTQR
jgi:hypothetical protein